jgi:hyperosmotically inducible protein
MLRTLLRLVIIVVVLIAAGTFYLGWWGGRAALSPNRSTSVGSTNTERAREVGATLGKKTAALADQAGAALDDGALTAKIKSKMVLDDTVKAAKINVDTVNGVVTVRGTVHTEAERRRAIQLARETNGVKQVVDGLTVR